MIIRTLAAVQIVAVLFLGVGLLGGVYLIRQSEVRCYCSESGSWKGDGWFDEQMTYEQCLADPVCQPKQASYYWKKYSRVIPYSIFVLALFVTTVFFLMMKNWARILSQAFCVFITGIYVFKYFDSMPFHSGIPWKLIAMSCALIAYAGFMILFLNRSEVKAQFAGRHSPKIKAEQNSGR